MNYCNITYPDINNGLGCRVTLWVSGCPHHCLGCHNPETWDRMVGRQWTSDSFEDLRKAMDHKYIKGLTLSGGEVFDMTDSPKLSVILGIVKKVKKVFGDSKDIWAYSGYTLDKLLENPETSEILEYVDILVDGPFVLSLKDTSIPFRGSSNQKVYKKSGSGLNFIEISENL